MRTFTSKFGPGDVVKIDGESSIKARVVQVNFRGSGGVLYEVAWFSNGVLQVPWIDEGRLEAWS